MSPASWASASPRRSHWFGRNMPFTDGRPRAVHRTEEENPVLTAAGGVCTSQPTSVLSSEQHGWNRSGFACPVVGEKPIRI